MVYFVCVMLYSLHENNYLVGWCFWYFKSTILFALWRFAVYIIWIYFAQSNSFHNLFRNLSIDWPTTFQVLVSPTLLTINVDNDGDDDAHSDTCDFLTPTHFECVILQNIVVRQNLDGNIWCILSMGCCIRYMKWIIW